MGTVSWLMVSVGPNGIQTDTVTTWSRWERMLASALTGSIAASGAVQGGVSWAATLEACSGADKAVTFLGRETLELNGV